MEPTGVERREGRPRSYFDGWMTFPQIADGDLSNDKGCGVMNWEKSGGGSDGKTNLIVGIVRGSWTKGHGGWLTMSKSVRIGGIGDILTSVDWEMGRMGKEGGVDGMPEARDGNQHEN